MSLRWIGCRMACLLAWQHQWQCSRHVTQHQAPPVSTSIPKAVVSSEEGSGTHSAAIKPSAELSRASKAARSRRPAGSKPQATAGRKKRTSTTPSAPTLLISSSCSCDSSEARRRCVSYRSPPPLTMKRLAIALAKQAKARHCSRVGVSATTDSRGDMGLTLTPFQSTGSSISLQIRISSQEESKHQPVPSIENQFQGNQRANASHTELTPTLEKGGPADPLCAQLSLSRSSKIRVQARRHCDCISTLASPLPAARPRLGLRRVRVVASCQSQQPLRARRMTPAPRRVVWSRSVLDLGISRVVGILGSDFGAPADT